MLQSKQVFHSNLQVQECRFDDRSLQYRGGAIHLNAQVRENHTITTATNLKVLNKVEIRDRHDQPEVSNFISHSIHDYRINGNFRSQVPPLQFLEGYKVLINVLPSSTNLPQNFLNLLFSFLRARRFEDGNTFLTSALIHIDRPSVENVLSDSPSQYY